jgi:hypothetical protein
MACHQQGRDRNNGGVGGKAVLSLVTGSRVQALHQQSCLTDYTATMVLLSLQVVGTILFVGGCHKFELSIHTTWRSHADKHS